MNKDKINFNAIAKGIHLCIRNAENFLNSAKLLLKENQARNSYLLGMYALEEMGKIYLIWNMPFYIEKGELEFKKWIYKLKDHGEKFWFAKDFEDVMKGNISGIANAEFKKDAIKKLNISYVGYENNKFVAPEKISNVEASELIENIEGKLKYLKSRHTSISRDEKILKTAFDNLKNLTYDDLTKLANSQGQFLKDNKS